MAVPRVVGSMLLTGRPSSTRVMRMVPRHALFRSPFLTDSKPSNGVCLGDGAMCRPGRQKCGLLEHKYMKKARLDRSSLDRPHLSYLDSASLLRVNTNLTSLQLIPTSVKLTHKRTSPFILTTDGCKRGDEYNKLAPALQLACA